mmetsp:Transcript_40810/g.117894  ORF Transcript_40810/g.117894 Transcript_40810/m.117894 type:complete len:85 (-) Transcript_40810:890-1144(-)
MHRSLSMHQPQLHAKEPAIETTLAGGRWRSSMLASAATEKMELLGRTLASTNQLRVDPGAVRESMLARNDTDNRGTYQMRRNPP